MFKWPRDCVLKEHEWLESTEYRLNIKQGTQAKEPTGLIRVIWTIRVLKKSSVCVLKEHEWLESTEYWLNIKQETQAAEPTGLKNPCYPCAT